jgi:hypothetical protein
MDGISEIANKKLHNNTLKVTGMSVLANPQNKHDKNSAVITLWESLINYQITFMNGHD